MRLVLASQNPDKAKELQDILADSRIEVLTLAQMGIFSSPEETGSTFLENARIKALAAQAELGTSDYIIADDSGLCVDALSGAPGIYSARYEGLSTSTERNQRLLHNLDGVENRKASFHCALVLLAPNGEEHDFYGEIEGTIAKKSQGTGGFGYDPLFVLDGTSMTMADLSEDEKNRVSHRAKATQALKQYLSTQ
jgi:XTP/dITP diphosphohydrolase